MNRRVTPLIGMDIEQEDGSVLMEKNGLLSKQIEDFHFARIKEERGSIFKDDNKYEVNFSGNGSCLSRILENSVSFAQTVNIKQEESDALISLNSTHDYKPTVIVPPTCIIGPEEQNIVRKLVSPNSNFLSETPSLSSLQNHKIIANLPTASLENDTKRQNVTKELIYYYSQFLSEQTSTSPIQDHKTTEISSVITNITDFKHETKEEIITAELVGCYPEHLSTLSNESDNDDKSIIQTIKCEKVCEINDKNEKNTDEDTCNAGQINQNKTHPNRDLSNAEDSRHPINKLNKKFVKKPQPFLYTFNNNDSIRLASVSVLLEDLFPKNSTRHTNKKSCLCIYCTGKFRLESEQQKDLETTSPRLKKFQKEKFHSKKEVLYHLPVHTDERLFFCAERPIKFKRSDTLKNHSPIHSSNKPFSCDLCSHTSKLKSHIRAHLQNVHFDKKVYQCKECGARLKSKHSLATHTVIHSNKRPFASDQCPARFKLKQTLRPHLNTVHSDQKPFSCTECCATFKSSGGLKIHLTRHSDDRPFSCSQCSFKFKVKSDLTTHIKRHFTDKHIKCPRCPAKFKAKDYLNTHLRRTHSEDKKMYSCAHCTGTFWTKSLLNSHLPVHSDIKPYSCTVCSLKCKWKSQLTSHMKTHAEKQYACELCSARFIKKENLKSHLKTHTNDKPYSCSLCPYVCRESQSLKVHSLKHSTARPYSCSVCSATFKDKSYMKRHLMSHSDEKPLACGHCSRTFKHKDILRMHIRTHTGEKPFRCQLCPAKFRQRHHLKSHLKQHRPKKHSG